MLPWLKRDKEASVSAPVESVERKPDEGEEEYDALESAVDELFAAFKSNDIKAGVSALRAFCDLRDSQPHEEGEHV